MIKKKLFSVHVQAGVKALHDKMEKKLDGFTLLVLNIYIYTQSAYSTVLSFVDSSVQHREMRLDLKQ